MKEELLKLLKEKTLESNKDPIKDEVNRIKTLLFKAAEGGKEVLTVNTNFKMDKIIPHFENELIEGYNSYSIGFRWGNNQKSDWQEDENLGYTGN